MNSQSTEEGGKKEYYPVEQNNHRERNWASGEPDQKIYTLF